MFRMCNFNFLTLNSQCCYSPLLFTPRAFGVGDTNCSQSVCYYIHPFRSAQGSLKILTNKQMNHKFKKINK